MKAARVLRFGPRRETHETVNLNVEKEQNMNKMVLFLLLAS